MAWFTGLVRTTRFTRIDADEEPKSRKAASIEQRPRYSVVPGRAMPMAATQSRGAKVSRRQMKTSRDVASDDNEGVTQSARAHSYYSVRRYSYSSFNILAVQI